MAPRGRPRKRLSRKDAAIDHMTQLGYDKELIRTTLKELLEEYGGEEQMAFIEADSYLVLIEALIIREESNAVVQMATEGDAIVEEPMPGTLVCHEAANTIVEEAVSAELICIGNGNWREDMQEDPLILSEGTSRTLCYGWLESDEEEEDKRAEKPADIVRSGNRIIGETTCYEEHRSGKQVIDESASAAANITVAEAVSTELICIGNGNRREDMREDPVILSVRTPRTPCYGWLESDEEEEDKGAEKPANIVRSGKRIVGETTCYEEHRSGRQVIDQSAVSSVLPSGSQVKPSGSNSHVDHKSSGITSSKKVKTEPPRGRFPCHGYIGIDGEEEDEVEIIYLTPRKPATFS